MRLHIHTKRHFNGALQEVWDLVTDMERFPSFFGGFGPIPAVTQVEVLYDTPKKGEKRKVHSADGGIISSFDTGRGRIHHGRIGKVGFSMTSGP